MKDLTPSREYIFPVTGFLVAAATVFARLREPMVANRGAAAIHLMNDRRSLRPAVIVCSGDIVPFRMFQRLEGLHRRQSCRRTMPVVSYQGVGCFTAIKEICSPVVVFMSKLFCRRV